MFNSKQALKIFIVGGVMALAYHYVVSPVIVDPIQRTVEEVVEK